MSIWDVLKETARIMVDPTEAAKIAARSTLDALSGTFDAFANITDDVFKLNFAKAVNDLGINPKQIPYHVLASAVDTLSCGTVSSAALALVTAYWAHLETQVSNRGGYKSLPLVLKQGLENRLPNLDPYKVQYVDMIDTGMQSSVTFGNSIFLYYNMVFSNASDLQNILHECCHVAQYSRLTIPGFLANYITQANTAILEGHISPHDVMPEETEANNFADNYLDEASKLIQSDPSLKTSNKPTKPKGSGSSSNPINQGSSGGIGKPAAN
jgi:hypothetical protein